jgi:hypothetical protein
MPAFSFISKKNSDLFESSGLFCAAIHNNARFELFKSDYIEIGGEFFVTKRRGQWTPVNAEELIFRHRETIIAMDIGQPAKVLHNVTI